MAITLTKVASLASTSNLSSYDASAFTPTANTVLIVFAALDATVADLGISDSGGLTWTKFNQAGGTGREAWWWAVSGGSPGSTTITVTCTGDAASDCAITVWEAAGADQSAPIVQNKRATGAAGATPAATFDAATTAGNAVIGVVGNSTNPAGVTEPSTYTETTDTGWATPTSGYETAHHNNPGSVTTVTWGSTSASSWTCRIAEIAAAAATPSLVFKQSSMRSLIRR